ncbi:MAG: MFS transporter, partial [Promethearchaeota archaeon]
VGLTTFYIYSTYFALDWFLNGLVQGISFLVIGFTHWLTGYYSDGLETKYGRRKPFVILGAPGLAIAGILLFIPHFFIPVGSPDPMIGWVLFGYYLVILCLFKFFYAFLLTAFQAWLPEITDENERPVVSSMQNTSNWLANGIGFVIGFLASTTLLFATGLPTSLMLMLVFAFAGIEILFYLPSIAFIREKPGLVIPKRSLKRETAIVLRNRTFVGWIMAVGFLSFTFNAITAQVVGFASNVLGLTSVTDLIIVAVGLFFTLILFLYIWVFIAKRVGKKRSLIFSTAILAIMLPLTILIGSVPLPPILLGVIFFLPMASCMSMYYIMSYVVPADIAQVDEQESGEARSGMYTGFLGVPLNIFQFMSSIVLGYVMALSVQQTGSSLLGYMWWGPIFTPTLIIAIIIMLFINLDPEFKSK